MSEEKKLTDEEIVKAWGICTADDNAGCIQCPYAQKKIDCVVDGRHYKDTLDLIRRLQDENKRLTEEANQDSITHIDICAENLSLRKRNAELQKQVDELKELNAKYIDSIESVQAGRCRYRCILTEQAVKDTAKEILNDAKKWVKEHYKDKVTDSFGERPMLFMEAFGCLLAYLKDKHGVEVE